MEVEKRGKGGFLQLFDWNGKSRKKLFSSKSDLHESSSHEKDNCHGSVIARRQLVLDKGFPLNATCHNDYPYASLAIGDSEQGTKVPGVVARLMGLDSLPTSNVNEPPCFNPFPESYSFRDSSYLMAPPPAFHGEHDIVIFESVRNKLDGSSRNPLDVKLQKVQNRHIERFQREVLPPKSAKPISVTHNRLLSPIKSPGFIPPKNAAYVIEAASKIIEQSPRSTTKGNFSPLGLPSGPFRVRDLQEKMESVQRSSQSADASQKGKEENSKNIKRQLNVRDKGRLEDSYQYKRSEESKRASSQRSKSNEKPVSAVQTKSNIYKRDGSISSGSRSSEKQKGEYGCVTRDLPNAQKKSEKPSSSRRPSEALRLNNQKQNRASAKDDENFEPSCSLPKERQESNLSSNYIAGRTNRTVNKIVVNNVVTSRKTNFVTADPGKDVSSLRAKTTSKKRLPINGNIQSSGGGTQKAMATKDEKSIKCNVAFESDSKWDGIDKKSSFDVVSFTFTSPIKKSAGSNSSAAILEATSSSSPSYDPCVRKSDLRTSAASSSSGFNVIGGDALSELLEQKLKELTSRVEFSQKDMLGSASLSNSVNNYGNMDPTVNLVESLPVDNGVCENKREAQDASDCASADKLWLQAEQASKGLEYFEGADDSNNIQRRLYLQRSTSLPSQPTLSGASCDSFDVGRSSSNAGRMACLSLDLCEGTNWRSTRKHHVTEGDPEISDTASSLSVGTMSETVSSSLQVVDSKDSSNWELKYIKDILSHAELLLEDFSLGQAHRIVAPDLFVQLENQTVESYKVMEENVLERKVLFDCVCECLENRCGQLLAGGRRFWGKQMAVLHRRQWLADDLYREIWRWTNAEGMMVDELVDKDMSSKSGKWVDFEVEAFEEGVEIVNRILTCLVDELIDDFLF